jgi:transposase InsO family protein
VLHPPVESAQYSSRTYRKQLKELRFTQSMSRTGNCYDNAVAESFFSTLKLELIYTQRWASHAELTAALFDYIEIFYNRQRLHSTLGYLSPEDFETQHAVKQLHLNESNTALTTTTSV